MLILFLRMVEGLNLESVKMYEIQGWDLGWLIPNFWEKEEQNSFYLKWFKFSEKEEEEER